MGGKLFIILAVFCTLVTNCLSSAPFRHKRGRFCGSNLVEAMALVCNRHYHSPNIKKSISYNQEFADDIALPDYSEDYGQNSPSSFHFFDRLFEDDSNPINSVRSMRRSKKGIYEECCANPCSLENMRAYCY